VRNTVNTHPESFLSFDLVKHIRDTRPTESELQEWLGASEFGRYHVLRKAGFLLLQEGRVIWSSQYLSADGRYFCFGHQMYDLDEGVIDVY
jgi:hypothetical protein